MGAPSHLDPEYLTIKFVTARATTTFLNSTVQIGNLTRSYDPPWKFSSGRFGLWSCWDGWEFDEKRNNMRTGINAL